jgi:hypothetical protein
MFAFVSGKIEELSSYLDKFSRRRLVFFYDLLWILILGVAAWLMTQKNNCILPTVSHVDWSKIGTACILWVKYKLFFNCMWFGALGGVTISLKGIYDHGAGVDPWKNDYNLWHLGRPASGAVAGLIAALLLYLVIPTNNFSPLVVYGVAFVFGTQDRAFFDFLSTFAGRFLPKNDQGATPLNVTGIHPAEEKAGTTVRITGQAIDKNAIVRIGRAKLDAQTVAPDGTSANGTVPKLGLQKDTKVDLEVINPGGRSIVLLEGFKYLGD